MRPEFIIITAFVTIVICGWLIGTYNKFIKYQNLIEEAWSSIDVALKRRFNLIPNLVSAIKGYSEHWGDTIKGRLAAITAGFSTNRLRTGSASPGSPSDP